MKIKIAKTVAALLLTQAALLADSSTQTDLNVDVSAIDGQITTVTAAHLEEQQASDVKDILKSIPGVSVEGNARYGQISYLRGLSEGSSSITVDGAKLGGQLFHHSGDQTVDASMLKSANVEIGPNSALSGHGVINGSFSYETKDPSDLLDDGEVFGGKVTYGYQSAYERNTGTVAAYGKINEKFEFLGMGTVSKDGTLHLGNGEDIESKSGKLESGLVKLVFKADDYNTFKLAYNKYKDGGNRQVTGNKAGTGDSDNAYSAVIRDTFTLNYEYKPENDLINVKANVYSNEQYLDRDSNDGTLRNSSVTYIDPARKYINRTSGYDLRNTSLFDIHKITVGTDYTHQEQEIDADGVRVYSDARTPLSYTKEKGKSFVYGVYAEDEMAFDKLILTLGARYDHYSLGGVYHGTFTQVSPKMKLKYHATNNLTLKSAYGRLFKGPSLGETYMLDASDTQSNNSKAQRGNNYEIGFDYNLASALNADRSVFGFNLYRYTVDGYSSTQGNNSLAVDSNMLLWGLESMFTYKKDDFGLRLSHTYTGGEETEISTGIKSDPSKSRIHLFKLGLNYQVTSELKMNYSGQAVPEDHYNTGTQERRRTGYAVHDIGFTLKPSTLKNTTLNFGVDNIFDKSYVTHTAIGSQVGSTATSYEAGRNFKFQVSYKF